MKEKMECPKCHRNVSKRNITTHQKTKRCINHIDKTDSRDSVTIKPVTSSPVMLPGKESVSNSKILTDLNLKGEFDKMTEVLNPKKKSGKDKKYQCGACQATFDNLNEGKCPDCGEQLQ